MFDQGNRSEMQGRRELDGKKEGKPIFQNRPNGTEEGEREGAK